MILTRIQHLKESLARQKKLGEESDLFDKFATRREKLVLLVTEFLSRADTWIVLRDAQLTGEAQVTWEKQAQSFGEKLKTIRENYAAEKKFVIETDRFAFKPDFETPVEAIGKKIEDAAKLAWQAHFERGVASQNKELLDTLFKIAAYTEAVKTIRRISIELENWRGRPPQNAGALQRFQSAAKDMQKAWDSLDGGNIPPRVLAFLKESASSGVPLDKLTDDVLAWLREHRIVSSFRIRASQS